VTAARLMPDESADSAARPDPAAEIRMATLHATRGANFWSTSPVTRLDLAVGAYEDISSADVPGFTERLVQAMPGLIEHRCSIGERGGFIRRLRRGTYAPHIIEHVALELQTMIGHAVGFGRTRGGDQPGEYTLVFEHVHESVGLRAAALALDAVQRAFAGTLESVAASVSELESLARTPHLPASTHEVLCGITGGGDRAGARAEFVRRGCIDDLLVDVSPAFLLHAGLPYHRSDMGMVLDAELADVPERYRERERADRLVSTLADGVRRGGVMIVPAKAWEIQDYARDARCRVAIFSTRDDVTRRDKRVARAAAWVEDGRIVIEGDDGVVDAGPVADDTSGSSTSVAAQVAGALAVFTLEEIAPDRVTRDAPVRPASDDA
jgi:Cyanophycin synthase-like N-terminal domain